MTTAKSFAVNRHATKTVILRLLCGCVALCATAFLLLIALDDFNVRSNVAAWQERAKNGSYEDQYTLGVWHLTGGNERRSRGLIRKDNQKAIAYLGAAAKGGFTKAYPYYATALERAGRMDEAKVWRDKAEHIPKH